MQLGYFHVIDEPVSTCVHEILEFFVAPRSDGGFHNTGQARGEGKDGELWRSLELPKNLVTQAGPREARKVDER